MKQDIPDSQSPALLVAAQDCSDLGCSYEQGWLLPGYPEAEGRLVLGPTSPSWSGLQSHPCSPPLGSVRLSRVGKTDPEDTGCVWGCKAALCSMAGLPKQLS